MKLKKTLAIILMKVSLRTHREAFKEFEDYINQELQLVFDIPMFRSINLNSIQKEDQLLDFNEDIEDGEIISIHDVDIIIPKDFYNKLLTIVGVLVGNDPQKLIEKLSDYLKTTVAEDEDLEDIILNIEGFKRYLTNWAAKEKGFTLIKGDKDAEES